MSGIREGVVEETLPKAMFRVRLDSGAIVRATLSAEAKRTIVRIIPGDRVTLTLSTYDPGRGRIQRRIP